MKTFDNNYAHMVESAAEFLYDQPPPADTVTYPTQGMADIGYREGGIYRTDVFGQPSSSSGGGGGYPPSGWVAHSAYGPPVLDTTWQSFVEQLGF